MTEPTRLENLPMLVDDIKVTTQKLNSLIGRVSKDHGVEFSNSANKDTGHVSVIMRKKL